MGKAQLVKSVLQSLSVYFMSIFKMSISIRKKIDRIQKDFLWSGAEETKRIALVASAKVCAPKEWGGLRIKNLKWMNSVLMGKLA